MMNHRLGVCALMAAGLVLLACHAAPANQIVLAVGTRGGLYYGKISGEVTGATQVRMQRQGSTDIDVFDQEGDEFWLHSPGVADLDTLNAAIPGVYTIEIDHPGGTSVYSFNVQPAQASWVPNAPSLQPVPPAIPPQYTFEWAWSGTADAKVVELTGWNSTDRFTTDEFFFSGESGFGALAYDADFGDFRGWGSFKIIYGNWMTNLVTDWSLVSGDDLFGGGADVWQVTEGVARADFQVVPEPATLALLAVAVAGLILRRGRVGR